MRAIMVAFTLALATAASASKYYVMGDWGGSPSWPFTTPAELKIAGSMAAGVVTHGVELTLVLGDNFYRTGVTDLHDPRFNTTFEHVFTGEALQAPKYEFWLIGGNHDHIGNISAQIEYSKVSPRWKFPSLYYTFTKMTTDGATIQFVMIDTIVLAGNCDGALHNILPGTTGHKASILPGPEDPAAAEEQWTFIESTLSGSTADYLIVAGHYPVWSVCENGPTRLLVQRLKPMLEQYQVSAYLAGHDHCAQYIDEGKGVQYHGIGAAHGCDTSNAHQKAVPKGSLKFLYSDFIHDWDKVNLILGAFGVLVADKTSLVIRHLNDEGHVLYTSPKLFPRKI